MRDVRFRDDQWTCRYTGTVKPINRFIDDLGAKDAAGHPPYIPLMYRGSTRLALSISWDPGPKGRWLQEEQWLPFRGGQRADRRTDGSVPGRSGHRLPRAVLPWNINPWYTTPTPRWSNYGQAGVEPLRDLIRLMPRLRVMLVHGTATDKGWKLFLREHLNLIDQRGIVWLSTYHTSRQALQTRDPVERKRREPHIRNACALAASVLRAPSWPAGSSVATSRRP
jgi:hypothetical protein